MILPRFDVLVPHTIDEACGMLARHADEGVRLVAGGTDLLVDLRSPIVSEHVPRCDGCPRHPEGSVLSTVDCTQHAQDELMPADGSLRAALADEKSAQPAFLVSLHRLDELKGIRKLENGGLSVGALTTITELERAREVRAHWTALSEGADQLGSPLVRNRGTIGGNIANARPAADTFIPTVALGGQLLLRGASGTRTVAAAEFASGPGASVIESDEIVTQILLPPAQPHSGSTYYKLANRKALEISTVGVAVWLALEQPGGPVTDVRVALGAVAPTPILAPSAAKSLVGSLPDEESLKKAAEAARGDARPINDHRGFAWYRLDMVEVLTYRLLKVAAERAGQNR